MKFSVHIPLGESLSFPGTCPFSGAPSSNRTVRLKQTKTLMVMPLPHGIHNSYENTSLRIPASTRIANLALVFEIMIWLSLLGAIGICVFLTTAFKGGVHERAALLCLFASPILALTFRFLRFMVVRKVYLKPANDGYAKLQFRSESYAREFSVLNHLQVFTD